MVKRKHVFICYAAKDAHFADRVRQSLEFVHIPVWWDANQPARGTSDWERTITAAIDSAFLIVLIASPEAKASPYVQGEIAFAEANNIPIYVMWARGLHWSRTVPMHMTEMPYLDARRDCFPEAQKNLIAQIKQLMSDTSLLRITDSSSEFATHVPENHIVVDFPNGHTQPMDIGLLGSVSEVASKLYYKGLVGRVQPDSYGTDWVLAQKVFQQEWESGYPVMRVAMGVDFLRERLAVPAQTDRLDSILERVVDDDVRGLRGLRVNQDDSHLLRQDPSYMGAVTGTRWQVLMPDELRLFAVAGVHREVLFPGMIPPEHSIESGQTLLRRLDKVRGSNMPFMDYLQAESRRDFVLQPLDMFNAAPYIESLNLFILQDVDNQFPELHNQVAVFSRE